MVTIMVERVLNMAYLRMGIHTCPIVQMVLMMGRDLLIRVPAHLMQGPQHLPMCITLNRMVNPLLMALPRHMVLAPAPLLKIHIILFLVLCQEPRHLNLHCPRLRSIWLSLFLQQGQAFAQQNTTNPLPLAE